MSFMDIFNGFRGQQPAADSQQSAAANTTVPSQATPGSDGKIPAIPETAKGSESPLENYADLWKMDTKSMTIGSPVLSPTLNVEPTKIMEIARQIDFTKGLDAEMLQKAGKGDIEALAGLINGAAQNAYAQGAMATTHIVRNAFSIQEKNFNETVMPSILRRHSISSVVAENPLSSNPAAAPLLQTLEQQLATKYPTASPAEIKTHAETYLTGLATEIVRGQGGTILPKDNTQGDPLGYRSKADTDWEKYFNIDSNQTA